MVTLAQDQDPDALRAAIMTQLRAHGVAKVVITFDGYSDDGQIESIGCTIVKDHSTFQQTFPAR
jgi:hypothetical protein